MELQPLRLCNTLQLWKSCIYQFSASLDSPGSALTDTNSTFTIRAYRKNPFTGVRQGSKQKVALQFSAGIVKQYWVEHNDPHYNTVYRWSFLSDSSARGRHTAPFYWISFPTKSHMTDCSSPGPHLYFSNKQLTAVWNFFLFQYCSGMVQSGIRVCQNLSASLGTSVMQKPRAETTKVT